MKPSPFTVGQIMVVAIGSVIQYKWGNPQLALPVLLAGTMLIVLLRLNRMVLRK